MEGAPNPEIISPYDAAVAALKEGIDTPGTREILMAWTISMEEQVNAAPTPEARAIAQIDFERVRGRLYIDAVYYESAREAWNGAYILANLAEAYELADKIRDDIVGTFGPEALDNIEDL